MDKIELKIPDLMAFPSLEVSRSGSGSVLFSWDPIQEICDYNNISIDVFKNSHEENVTSLIHHWYGAYLDHGGTPDETMEALIAETKTELLMEELAIPLSYKSHDILPEDCQYRPIYMGQKRLPLEPTVESAKKALDTHAATPDWYPSLDEITRVLKKIGSQREIGYKLKLGPASASTIRSWMRGTRQMGYSTWRSIRELAGEFVEPWE